ncbi:MAG: SpoIVB peptidase [Bacilli bacterium]|nr:SpoIVB peptidase [Bacilli bacterium]
MKIKNKLLSLMVLLLFIIPLNVFAYSSHIIPGGETIGIEVNSKGVLVVGFYKVNNSYIGRNAGFEVGDKIIKLDGVDVNSISSMIEIINKSTKNTVEFTILRGSSEKNISLNLTEGSDGVLKTGLYVKDSINGIGTLTYIDPETMIFGALGHEIVEKTTAKKFEIKDGIIFGADVVAIEKSTNGNAGEKNAKYDKTEVFGKITGNEISGIFGTYTKELSNKEKLEVAESKDIKTGKATIRTVIKDDKVDEFSINILKLDESNETKNILFEVIDERLLKEAGGIVQGMSGSPIIQNGKIIGAVTHVIVNDTTKGYGIFITTMLKEGEN